ncbi:MAG: metal-dependent hydrolase [Anaerolineae bacterium]|nr:metal-dependent hydrolase [Anaerolineae bacterium]
MTQGGHIGASLIFTCTIERLIFHAPPGVSLLVAGAVLGNLPDFDVLIAPLAGHIRGEKRLHHHRYVTHAPAFYLLLAALAALFAPAWGLRLALLSLGHLLLDSWHTDDGVMWLWPFSRRQYSLFPYPAHEGELFGLAFYRQHLRRPLAWIPEVAFLLGGTMVLANAIGNARFFC